MPNIVAGHSLGEYTALVAAGALSFEDALPLVRHRAAAMQEAVPEGIGGMAAILGLDDDAVLAVCREAAQGDVLEAANFNAPSQVVIAGNKAGGPTRRRSGQSEGGKTERAAPDERSFPLQPNAAGGGASHRLSLEGHIRHSNDSRGTECGRGELW